MGKVERVQAAIARLDAQQLIEVSNFVSGLVQRESSKVQMQAPSVRVSQAACLHCGTAGHIQKWGKSKAGTQRFKCSNCRKTYRATMGTPLYRLRFRDEWERYLTLMRSHISIRALRKDYGFQHHTDTLLRWRHRFLSYLMPNPDPQLAGLIEADEKFFRTYYKGTRTWKRGGSLESRRPRRRGGANQRGLSGEQVPVLTAMDRTGAIRQARLPDMKWLSITTTMTPWVEKESVICSDGHAVYPVIAKVTGCECWRR